MTDAAAYNQKSAGIKWNLMDLPPAWPGYKLLVDFDEDKDNYLDPREIQKVNWELFTNAVKSYQQVNGLEEDGKLGPKTIAAFKRELSDFEVRRQLGPLTFKTPTRRTSPPENLKTLLPHSNNVYENTIIHIWNSYGKPIAKHAKAHEIPTSIALSVFAVEAKRAYSDLTDLITIRFEPHIFRRLSPGQSVDVTRKNQITEWEALAKAYALDPSAALKSCSWGLAQLMGFNYKVTKFNTVEEMVLAFQDDVTHQVASFFEFCHHNKLLQAIHGKNWNHFVSLYNGPANVKDYSGKLSKFLAAAESYEIQFGKFTD